VCACAGVRESDRVRVWGVKEEFTALDIPIHTVFLLKYSPAVCNCHDVCLSICLCLVCPYVRTCVLPTARLQRCLSGLESLHLAASHAPGEGEDDGEREGCVCVFVCKSERE
jgi:hypothetical protein